MEDIDVFLNRLREEQEVDDFINKGIYPERLISHHKHHTVYFPKMEEPYQNKKLHNIVPIESSFVKNLQEMTTKLNDIEKELKTTIEREKLGNSNNNLENNDCPICMDCMGDRNYIVPICGHKICVKCFVTNITTNRESGCLCSLCREKIV